MTGLWLAAIPVWLYGLARWKQWYEPILILAACSLLERPEPEPATAPFDLTVADTRWGRATWPAVAYELVVQ
jgi:hypothetical protein